jgi:predicted aspartyl protease
MFGGRSVTIVGALVAGAVATPISANAADTVPCALQEAVSLDLVRQDNGFFNIPVQLDDQPMVMGIDTGSTGTSISEATATKLGLPISAAGDSRVFVSNIKIDTSATLKSFGLGRLAITDWPVWIIPNTLLDRGIVGLVGSDSLMSFDIEFDPAHSKFNLFVPNTCTKDAAYWTHGTVAAVPLSFDRASHITLDATLDGRSVTVLLDTGSFNSFMSIDVAEDMFGFRSDDPRLKSIGAQPINGGPATPVYEFPFKSLGLEGFTISNPNIELLPRDLFPRGFRDQSRIVLGMNVLRHLRMYIAYKQRVIYLTDASAQ